MKPLGLLMIASHLKQCGCSLDLLDCLDRFNPLLMPYVRNKKLQTLPDGRGAFLKTIIEKPAVLAHVPRRYGRYGWPLPLVRKRLSQTTPPQAILITSGMTYWYPGVKEMIGLIKQSFPDVPVILGGTYATLCHEHARRVSGADIVLPGSGLVTLSGPLGSITGLSIPAPSRLPSPFYELYPRLASVALITSLGCPRSCKWCASGLLFPAVIQRDPAEVCDDIERLYSRQGVTQFAFFDDALLYQKEKYFLTLLEEVIKLNLPLSFHTPNGLEPKAIDRETAHLMKRAGFDTIRLSYESSNQRRQADMGHKVSDADLTRAVNHLLSAGFAPEQIGAYVLMGLPGQEAEETAASMEFVLRLGIRVHLASFSPIPGTACWQEAVDYGLISADTDPLLHNNSVFPLASDIFPIRLFQTYRTVANQANKRLTQGLEPNEQLRSLRLIVG